MNPGIVGVLALVGTAGVIYAGGQWVGNYFAAQNQVEVAETGEPLGLVPDVETDDAPADEAAPVETAAAPEVTAPVDEEASDADMASDMADADAADAPDMASEPEADAPVLDVVRVEPTGEAVIAGSAGEGARIGLLYNDELIADTEADAAGDFVIVPDVALPSGEGTMEVVVLDEDGDVVAPSEEQVAVVLPEDGSADGFLVSVLRPDQPVEIIERVAPETDGSQTEVADASQDAGTEETASAETSATETPSTETEVAVVDEPTSAAQEQAAIDAATPIVTIDAIELEGLDIWIAGAADPGTIVRLYQNNEILGEALTGDEGRYLYEGTLSAATGTVTVRADALAPGTATVVARAEVPFDMPGVEVATASAVGADASEVETASSDGAATADETGAAAEDTATAAATTTEDDESTDVAETATPAAGATATETAVAEPTATDAQTETETASTASEAPADTSAAETATETASAAVETPAATEQASTTADQTATPQRVSVLDTGRVIIRRGDNLWRLSRRVYGQGIRYTSIYDANRDQIGNPALIFPGQVFDLPTPQPAWGEVPGFEALEPDQVPEAGVTSETTSG